MNTQREWVRLVVLPSLCPFLPPPPLPPQFALFCPSPPPLKFPTLFPFPFIFSFEMCQKLSFPFFFLFALLFQMNYQQKVNRNEKLHKTLAGDELLVRASSPPPAPSSAFPSLSSTTHSPKAPPPRPRRPFPRIRIVRPRPHVRFVSSRSLSLFRFQCSAKNDTNESFCHSKCPDAHRWTAGVRAIPSLSRDCPNSCGLCGNSSICMDRDPRCRLFRSFCRGRFYSYDWKRIYCGRTCKLC